MAEVLPSQPDRSPGAVPSRVPAGPYVARRDLRVSDAERQTVVDELRTHFGAGRIDLAEFEERTQAALAARVRGDLHPLLDDLPDLGPPPPHGPPVRARQDSSSLMGCAAFRIHLYLTLVVSVFLVVIWAGAASVGGTWMFWPIFPIAGLAVPLGIHAAFRAGNSPPLR